MKIFKKKNLSDDFNETLSTSPLDGNHLSYTILFTGIGILTGISFYLLKKFNKSESVKDDNNITVYTTKLEY